MPDTTLEYYNQNADLFIASSIQADMSGQYAAFTKYLRPGAAILDLGCGSGRDSKYFLDQGYAVESVDGSTELCRLASEFIGKPVRLLTFQALDYVDKFDAIWACASLLHLTTDALPTILKKIHAALVADGIFYASFKYGHFRGERNGRFFTYFTEPEFSEIIEHSQNFDILETTVTFDKRPGHSGEQWLNVIMRKRA